MNILLDTHVLIWWLGADSRLGSNAREVLVSEATRACVSAVSIWEISIKAALGKLNVSSPLEDWVPRLRTEWGVRPLPVSFEHAMAVRILPKHHNDPFDRMLVAQAQCEGLVLLTADPAVMAYDVRTLDANR